METLRYFFNFFLFFTVFILLILTLSEVFFRNFKLDSHKVKYYGIFMDLKNTQIMSLTLITVKFVYIIYCLLNIGNTYLSLILIVILTILYNVHNIRIINIIFDIVNSVILYLIILSKDIFIDYILHVDVVWYAIVLYIISVIFGLVCAIYNYIKDILYILKKNKYIKAKENSKIIADKRKKIKTLLDELKEDINK